MPASARLAVLASLACIAGSFDAPRITVVNPTGSIGFAALKQLKERTDGASQVRALLFNDVVHVFFSHRVREFKYVCFYEETNETNQPRYFQIIA